MRQFLLILLIGSLFLTSCSDKEPSFSVDKDRATLEAAFENIEGISELELISYDKEEVVDYIKVHLETANDLEVIAKVYEVMMDKPMEQEALQRILDYGRHYEPPYDFQLEAEKVLHVLSANIE